MGGRAIFISACTPTGLYPSSLEELANRTHSKILSAIMKSNVMPNLSRKSLMFGTHRSNSLLKRPVKYINRTGVMPPPANLHKKSI